MKRLLPYLLFLSICGLCFISCQNDEINELGREKFDQSMTFMYMGNTYVSEYYQKDGSYFFSNPEVQEVYNHIKQLPELCTYVNEKGISEYYDNYKEYEKLDKPDTRAIGNRVTTWAKLSIYEHANHGGWTWGYFLDEKVHSIDIPNLDGYFGGNMYMNNKTTSFKLETYYIEFTGTPPTQNHGDYTEVIFFEGTNYSGPSVVWKGNPYNQNISILNIAGYNWPYGSPASMDNSISSLKFRYTNN